MSEAEERAAVVAAARGWIGTKFHHHAAVKGHGIDCAHLILQAHVEAGLVDLFETEAYPADWMFHRDEERFAAKIEEYASQVGDELILAEQSPDFIVKQGNILIWKYGRTFSHSAIVSDWPMIIHASHPARCCLEESVFGTERTERRPVRIYSYWGS